MTDWLQEWEDHYRPLLGRRLQTFCFRPLAGADTPDLVRTLEESPVWFTGAVEVVFEQDSPIFLTWGRAEDGFRLLPCPVLEDHWPRYSLDSIRKSPEGPWEGFEGATLEGVRLHTMEGVPGGPVVAAEHGLATDGGSRLLWIGTAHQTSLEDGDDLCVGVDSQPPSRAPLVLMGAIQ